MNTHVSTMHGKAFLSLFYIFTMYVNIFICLTLVMFNIMFVKFMQLIYVAFVFHFHCFLTYCMNEMYHLNYLPIAL